MEHSDAIVAAMFFAVGATLGAIAGTNINKSPRTAKEYTVITSSHANDRNKLDNELRACLDDIQYDYEYCSVEYDNDGRIIDIVMEHDG